jgi:hypothetical protein
VDGATLWHNVQTAADRFIRVRSANSADAVWSEAIGLVAGPQGDPGADAFCYVAYASDSTGTGFSLTPTNGLKFRRKFIPIPKFRLRRRKILPMPSG